MSTSKHGTSPAPLSGAVQALTELTLAVFRLHGALLQWGDVLVGPLGLTSARWQMLGAIAIAGKPLSAPQVGDAMGVTRQGAQKQLHLLVDLGLVEARANPAHRRSPVYGLTPRGRQLYQRAEAAWATSAADLAAVIPADQALSARAILDAMRLALNPSQQPPEDAP